MSRIKEFIQSQLIKVGVMDKDGNLVIGHNNTVESRQSGAKKNVVVGSNNHVRTRGGSIIGNISIGFGNYIGPEDDSPKPKKSKRRSL